MGVIVLWDVVKFIGLDVVVVGDYEIKVCWFVIVIGFLVFVLLILGLD